MKRPKSHFRPKFHFRPRENEFHKNGLVSGVVKVFLVSSLLLIDLERRALMTKWDLKLVT